MRERCTAAAIMDFGSDRAFVEFGARGRERSEDCSIDSRETARDLQLGRLDCSTENSSRGEVEFINIVY